ncbi:Ig-like domain-containing protein [bacterium]|nr:Ig-like domain-containing protein [bacterium]
MTGNEYIAPYTNDNFICTRAGEGVTITVVSTDRAGTNPIDLSSIVINKTPDHASVPVVVAPGTVTYTPTTRYIGRDTFTYRISDTNAVPSVNYGTVDIEMRADPPATAEPRFIYSLGTNINFYSGGTTGIIHTTAGSSPTSLATNRDDNLIYWAEGTTIFAYDYIAGSEFVVIADITADGRFSGGNTSLSSGGATYNNGVYYVGGSGSSTTYYRIVFDTYVPGSLSQSILDVTTVSYSDGLARDMGDLQYDTQTENLIVSSTTSSTAPTNGAFSVVDPSSGQIQKVVSYSGALAATVDSKITVGVDDIYYASDGSDVYTLNLQSGGENPFEGGGGTTGIVALLDGFPLNMSEHISQPC